MGKEYSSKIIIFIMVSIHVLATNIVMAIVGWVRRKETLINLMRRQRTQMELLMTTRPAALHLTLEGF